DVASSGNNIGNTIGGLDTDGNVLLGHGGIHVESGADENVIAGNNIGFNPASSSVNAGAGPGVRVAASSGNGIGDDVAPPGLWIPDGAAVGIQPPTITSAVKSGATTTITGTLSGAAANTTFYIEIFGNAQCDSSGFGEGQTYSGFFQATTDASGNATFTSTA